MHAHVEKLLLSEVRGSSPSEWRQDGLFSLCYSLLFRYATAKSYARKRIKTKRKNDFKHHSCVQVWISHVVWEARKGLRCLRTLPPVWQPSLQTGPRHTQARWTKDSVDSLFDFDFERRDVWINRFCPSARGNAGGEPLQAATVGASVPDGARHRVGLGVRLGPVAAELPSLPARGGSGRGNAGKSHALPALDHTGGELVFSTAFPLFPTRTNRHTPTRWSPRVHTQAALSNSTDRHSACKHRISRGEFLPPVPSESYKPQLVTQSLATFWSCESAPVTPRLRWAIHTEHNNRVTASFLHVFMALVWKFGCDFCDNETITTPVIISSANITRLLLHGFRLTFPHPCQTIIEKATLSCSNSQGLSLRLLPVSVWVLSGFSTGSPTVQKHAHEPN